MGKPREPSLGIDLRFIEDVPSIATAAGQPEAAVGWGMVKLWKFCWSAKKAEVTSMMLQGFVPGCTQALLAFDMIRPTGPNTFEVAGLGRYLRTKEAQSLAAQRATAYRLTQRDADRPNSSLSGSLTDSLSDRQIEDRRSFSTDPKGSVAEQQTELAIGEPEEPAVDEPDSSLTEVSQKARRTPPAARQLSPAEEVWVQMVEERRTRLVALQLDHEPDEKPAPAFVNSAFKRLVSRMRESDEGAGEHDVLLAYQRYLESPYGKNRKPPFALQAFLQDWCWRENWELIGTSKDPLRATGP